VAHAVQSKPYLTSGLFSSAPTVVVIATIAVVMAAVQKRKQFDHEPISRTLGANCYTVMQHPYPMVCAVDIVPTNPKLFKNRGDHALLDSRRCGL
jgi:hypothetical protein